MDMMQAIRQPTTIAEIQLPADDPRGQAPSSHSSTALPTPTRTTYVAEEDSTRDEEDDDDGKGGPRP